MLKKLPIALFFSSLMSLTTIAHADTVTPTDPQDPYENLNRHTYQMNQTIDKVLIKPIATVYNAILPWPLKKGISNFFSNLAMIPTVGNDILQGQGRHAVSDTWRFAINSTVGVGGLFDVASPAGFPAHSNDLGLTFAKWGYKDSAYFVIPLLGPSTVRDAVSFVPNYQFMTVYPYINSWKVQYGLAGLNLINQRANLLNFQNVIDSATLDQYVFERDAYLQRRAYLISENNGGSLQSHANDSDLSDSFHY